MEITIRGACCSLVLAVVSMAASQAGEHIPRLSTGYCVVVSTATRDDPQWKRVVEALAVKHEAFVIAYDRDVNAALPELQREFPRYACFVAKPSEATAEFVVAVSKLACRLDDDPYIDVLWGILTAYNADGALRIARQAKPLTIRRAAAGTEIELASCEEGVWYCELNQGKMVRKERGGKPVPQTAPADTTAALVDALNVYKADLFVTSGHATERDWQIGYAYRNGQFRSGGGKLWGLDTAGKRFPVESPNPKVYLPVGNCLMGQIDGPDAMALAFLQSAGVHQMIGYTVPTWYGYMGWGLLDYFVEQPDRFTAAEAFYANGQALRHRLATYFPDAAGGGRPTLSQRAREAGLTLQDARGLLFDRDCVAFYGDPAWHARMAPGPLAWEQSLEVKDGAYWLRVRPLRGERSFEPINRNGSQRGGRPIVQRLPWRIDVGSVQISAGAELEPLIADDFLLLPLPRPAAPGKTYDVRFRAKPATPRAEGPANPSPAAATREPAQPKVVSFAGMNWTIKTGPRFGPGPNGWSEECVKVDDHGLSLSIRQQQGVWQCGEVVAEKPLGYGTYTWVIAGDLQKLDVQTVLGLFLYRDDRHEIDFELARWGKAENENGQFVVQAADGGMRRFDTKDATTLTVSLHWSEGLVRGRCWSGEDTRKTPLCAWDFASPQVPRDGGDRARANLWLMGGKPPTSGQSQRVVIRSFEFDPAK